MSLSAGTPQGLSSVLMTSLISESSVCLKGFGSCLAEAEGMEKDGQTAHSRSPYRFFSLHLVPVMQSPQAGSQALSPGALIKLTPTTPGHFLFPPSPRMTNSLECGSGALALLTGVGLGRKQQALGNPLL